MPQPSGAELDAVRERRRRLRDEYLVAKPERPPTTARGVHHAAFVCKDVEETIRFYQEFLGFPLVELVENRDYAGSSHFFFDVGNRPPPASSFSPPPVPTPGRTWRRSAPCSTSRSM